MAQVLKNVKDTKQEVATNTRRIHRLELKLTQVLQDAIGRSY